MNATEVFTQEEKDWILQCVPEEEQEVVWNTLQKGIEMILTAKEAGQEEVEAQFAIGHINTPVGSFYRANSERGQETLNTLEAISRDKDQALMVVGYILPFCGFLANHTVEELHEELRWSMEEEDDENRRGNPEG